MEHSTEEMEGIQIEPCSDAEVGACFPPTVPQSSIAPPATIKTKVPRSGFDRVLQDMGFAPTAIVPDSAPASQKPATNRQHRRSLQRNIDSSVRTQTGAKPSPRRATTVEMFTWIKRCLVDQTPLEADVAELVAFWVISTWFQDVLPVLPCLVLTGDANGAMAILCVLEAVCRSALRVVDLRKADMTTIASSCHTALISAPNLTPGKLALLSSGTTRGFRVVAQGRLLDCSMSRALYAGENPLREKVQNAISVHIASVDVSTSTDAGWQLRETEWLAIHLAQYRETHLDRVRSGGILGLHKGPEYVGVEAALGQCLLDASSLRDKLAAHLHNFSKRKSFEVSSIIEVVVVEAAVSLSRGGREYVFARDIAAQANRFLEARGEIMRITPETVGHRLKKLRLHTQRLSKLGTGLRFDNRTLASLQQLADVFLPQRPTEPIDQAQGLSEPLPPMNKGEQGSGHYVANHCFHPAGSEDLRCGSPDPKSFS